MKRYQNIGKMIGTVVLETYTQFLSRGQYFETDENVVSVSKEIVVIDLVKETQSPIKEPVIESEHKPVVEKRVRKKRTTKKITDQQ